MENDLCAGCFRTIDEIAAWSKADDDRRRQILTNATQRRAQHDLDIDLICNDQD